MQYKNAIAENQNSYTLTKGVLQLREAIANHYTIEYGCEYDSNNVIVSNGTANLLFLLFQVLFDPGDAIIVLEPYFLIYHALSKYHKMSIFYLNEDFSEDDIARLYSLDKKPKSIIFSSPSNPSGYILKKSQIELICQYARKYNTIIISDEIYKLYDYENIFYSPANIFPENTLLLSGFSKSHSMTGLRIGYLLANQTQSLIINSVADLQQYSSVCAPAPVQWGALVALETSIKDNMQKMKERRDIVISYLKDKTNFTYPSGAFYVFPEIPTNCDEFVQKALQKSLLVVPGNIFQRSQNHVRISYAQDKKILVKSNANFCRIAVKKILRTVH